MKIQFVLDATPQFFDSLSSAAREARRNIEALDPSEDEKILLARKRALESLDAIAMHAQCCADLINEVEGGTPVGAVGGGAPFEP